MLLVLITISFCVALEAAEQQRVRTGGAKDHGTTREWVDEVLISIMDSVLYSNSAHEQRPHLNSLNALRIEFSSTEMHSFVSELQENYSEGIQAMPLVHPSKIKN